MVNEKLLKPEIRIVRLNANLARLPCLLFPQVAAISRNATHPNLLHSSHLNAFRCRFWRSFHGISGLGQVTWCPD